MSEWSNKWGPPSQAGLVPRGRKMGRTDDAAERPARAWSTAEEAWFERQLALAPPMTEQRAARHRLILSMMAARQRDSSPTDSHEPAA